MIVQTLHALLGASTCFFHSDSVESLPTSEKT